MNYIKKLQEEVEEHKAARAEAVELIDEFMNHLQSTKFRGAEEDGTRRDWIATGDVLTRLAEIRSTLT